MENELIKLAASQGIWAVLSIILIFYIIKAQEKRDLAQETREKNYQNLLSKLTDKLNILVTIKQDIRDLKDNNLKK